MAILKVATSTNDFTVSSGDLLSTTTAANISPHVDEGVSLDGSGSQLDVILSAPVNPAFFTFYLRDGNTWNDNREAIQLFDSTVSTTIPVLQVRRDTGGSGRTYNLTAYDGATQVEVAGPGAFGVVSTTVYRWDIEVNIADVGGYVRVYIDTVLLMEWTGDTNTWTATGIDRIRWHSETSSIVEWISGFMAADTNLRDPDLMILVQHDTIAAGTANTAAAGTAAEVDELGINAADYLLFDTTGQEFRYTSNLPTAYETGYDVVAHVINPHAGTWGGEPFPEISAGPRVAGTNYMSVVGDVLSFQDYTSFQRIMATNPATGVAWTIGAVDGLEQVLIVGAP